MTVMKKSIEFCNVSEVNKSPSLRQYIYCIVIAGIQSPYVELKITLKSKETFT